MNVTESAAQPDRSTGEGASALDESRVTSRVLARTLDWIERVAIATIFGVVVITRHDTLFDPDTRTWFILFLISEGLVVFFILIRRVTDDVTLRVRDWMLAASASFLPLLATAGGDPLIPVSVGALLVLLGVSLQLSAKLILARSFGLIAANRGVKVRGPYRLVRHPMYAGYLITHIGLLLTSPLLLNLIVYVAAFSLQILRIFAEERILLGDETYRNYAQGVKYRVIPRVF